MVLKVEQTSLPNMVISISMLHSNKNSISSSMQDHYNTMESPMAKRLFGQKIEEVESHVYLGLRFSKNLRWTHHIHDISLKARKKLNLMVPLKYKLDRKSLEIMYKAFVLPSLEYANVVWGGSYDSDILKLEIIHVDAMRLVTGATARRKYCQFI